MWHFLFYAGFINKKILAITKRSEWFCTEFKEKNIFLNYNKMFGQYFYYYDAKKMRTAVCTSSTGQKQITISYKRETSFNLKSFKLICI
jgi:hypothetical protein